MSARKRASWRWRTPSGRAPTGCISWSTNAGVSWGADYAQFPHAAWAKVMSVNVAGLFTLTRELTPLLVSAASDDDPARIINLGFGDGHAARGRWRLFLFGLEGRGASPDPDPGRGTLSAAKSPSTPSPPGPFQSRMTAFATARDEQVEKVSAGVPLGRIGGPDDVAGATIYLCSRAGSYITGAILPIDGGLSVQHDVRLFKDA